MQFKKLRLTGFKSFVDPTEMVIADGLTGVVGPNGCGKSNLLEALRWVMGENRPTSMRGGGMDDVIFAGATRRPARNFAEVALSIENGQDRSAHGFDGTGSVEVVRRITRDIGSAYRINGKECRARDVQRMFADAATGAQSPALVRQGQISELVNARLKSRRRILEEAAGISGLHQRRHEAELKLKGAESNLEKVADIIGQLEGQVASLERQARQAARYREIGASLRRSEGLLLYRRWREADSARQEASDALAETTGQVARAQAMAVEASARRNNCDERLASARSEDAAASAALERIRVERENLSSEEDRAHRAIEMLRARAGQLGNDLERERALNNDAVETIARLDADFAELEGEAEGSADRLDEAAEAAREAAGRLADLEASLDALGEDLARLVARRQSSERRLAEATSLLERREKQAGEIAEAAAVAGEALSSAEGAVADARAADGDARSAVRRAEARLSAALAAHGKAQEIEASARGAHAEADGKSGALAAEVAALERVIARARQDDGGIMDSMRVDVGFEAALGAAFGDDVRLPEAGADDARSGWVALGARTESAGMPQGSRPLTDHVDAPPVLARRLRQTFVVDRRDGTRLQCDLEPGQRLVSVEGDMWRWDGFRVSAEDAPSLSREHYLRVNRLDAMKSAAAEAGSEADRTSSELAAARAALATAAGDDSEARADRKAADDAATAAARALSRAEADRDMRAGKLEALTLSRDRLGEEMAAARDAVSEAEADRAGAGEEEVLRNRVEALREDVGQARAEMIARRSRSDSLRRENEERGKRLAEIARERDGWSRRLGTAETRIRELEKRRSETDDALARAVSRPDQIRARRDAIGQAVDVADARHKAASDALAEAEAETRAAERDERERERAASAAREAQARADAVLEAAAAKAAEAVARIKDETSLEPEALLGELDADPDRIPAADVIEAETVRLRRQRDALGAVNLRAEEDARQLAAERDGLAREREDLEAAVARLRSGIARLNRDGRERLLAAFSEVDANFGTLFRHLFGGGEAKLELVESDDPLEAGLEIVCQPPGKKLATLSLLSGGEQTLTALALIFAVFLVNPSPICVLDEVDAPLDDANVTRFCDLLDEMTRRTDTRFMIITHHAITMARMDRLFGVTMAELGVSQLVSVDLRRAEAMVDA